MPPAVPGSSMVSGERPVPKWLCERNPKIGPAMWPRRQPMVVTGAGSGSGWA